MNEQKNGSTDLNQNDLDLDKFNAGDGQPENFAKKTGLLIFEIVKVVLISLAIIIPIRLFLVQPFYVEGASMEPNFHDSEYLVINEISYRFQKPVRGEVVIFKSPADSRVYFIKRVIGLPGEKIELSEGRVYINGKELKEDYIAHFSSEDDAKVTLGPNEYYVLGDNRTNSHDSRRFGPIDKGRIIGKVWFRGWPLDRIGTFNIPSYQ